MDFNSALNALIEHRNKVLNDASQPMLAGLIRDREELEQAKSQLEVMRVRADLDSAVRTTKFFQRLNGQEPSQVACFCSPVQGEDASSWVTPVSPATARVKNRLGADVYFQPNDGGRKDCEINRFNAFYLDFDCGKAPDGGFKPLAEVAAFKRMLLAKLKSLPAHSSIVETRNGLHVYWFIAEAHRAGIDAEKWNQIERALLQAADQLDCGVDRQVTKPSQLLRMPDSTWRKLKKGNAAQPFLAQVYRVTDVSWDPDALLAALPVPSSKPCPVPAAPNVTAPAAGNERIEAIREFDAGFFHDESIPRRRLKFKQAVAFLKSTVCLPEYLGTGYGPIRCVFHRDTSPSARLLPPQEGVDGACWLYYCHSSNCEQYGRVLDVFGVVQALTGENFKAAVRFVAECFGIDIPDSKPRVDHSERNAAAIRSITAGNPARQKKLAPLLRVYEALIDCQKHCAELTGMAWKMNELIFSASSRFLARLADETDSKAFKKSVLLAALGLVQKISDDDLPKNVLRRDRDYLAQLRLNGYKTIQYYKFSDISTLQAMREVQRRIDLWIASGRKIDEINYGTIAAVFGSDIAEACYVKPLDIDELELAA